MKKHIIRMSSVLLISIGLLTQPVLAAPSWVQSGSQWYLEENGQRLLGWQKLGEKYYYLGSDGIMRKGWQYIDQDWFYLDEFGAMKTGWQRIDGNWFYLHEGGQMAKGWLQKDGDYFFLKEGGQMVVGWHRVGSVWYYFHEGGQMAKGWHQIAGRWYYFNENGNMLVGRQQINGATYFFTETGAWATADEQMLILVNEHRAAYGRAPLKANTALQSYANIRLAELAVSYSHTRPNGEQATTAILRDYGFQAGGENIAYGYPTVADVFAAWRASEGHNRNMLSTHFSEFAFATDGYYAVQLFSR